MTTLRDIAAKAGVSNATVSRVLNASAGVTPDIERKVRAVTERLGYQPRVQRPGPKTTGRKGLRTGNILLFFAGFNAGVDYGARGYPSLMRGVGRALHDAGLKMMLAGLEHDGGIPAALDAREVDGVLLFVYSDPGKLSNSALALLDGIPTVSLMRDYAAFHDRFDQVLFSNARIGPMAADYLIGRKHRRLAFTNERPNHPAFRERLAGFTSHAQAAGIDVLSLVGPRDADTYREQVVFAESFAERLLTATPRPTGIFVAADYQIPQLYQALERRKIRPGRDVEIIGCDNEAFFLDRVAPRPPTIDPCLELLSDRGVQQLLWRMAHRDVTNRMRLVIEPMLVPADEAKENKEAGSGAHARRRRTL